MKLAYLYLRQYPFEQALERTREKIQRYNALTDTPDELERGYHETVTVAWLRLVEFTLREYGPAASADEFRTTVLAQGLVVLWTSVLEGRATQLRVMR